MDLSFQEKKHFENLILSCPDIKQKLRVIFLGHPLYQKVNTLEHEKIAPLKGDIKTLNYDTEKSLSNIRGLINWYIKKVNFIMGHPVYCTC